MIQLSACALVAVTQRKKREKAASLWVMMVLTH